MDSILLFYSTSWTLILLLLLLLARMPGARLYGMPQSFDDILPGKRSQDLLTLAKGFDALLEAAKKLTRQEELLRSKLQAAHNEYQKLSSLLTETSTTRTNASDPFLTDSHSEKAAFDTTAWVRNIEQSGVVNQSDAKAILDAMAVTKVVMDRNCRRNQYSAAHGCPFSKPDVRPSIERDFTTSGTKGNLGCPFSRATTSVTGKTSGGADAEICGNDDLDPIKAESRSGAPPCVAGSARSATARCPIRFLNAHSPEEIAEFFQKHKHEIPRSHSICIQRYQKNPANLRQLDEKYGDLVSMVKGLGVYHQPYLPPSSQLDAELKHEKDAAERVERWAEDIRKKSPTGIPLSDIPDDEKEDEAEAEAEVAHDNADRVNHFDRSLPDVRVGESPSRPWGIHVPVTHEPPRSDVASLPAPVPVNNWQNGVENHPAETADPLGHKEKHSTPKGRCPINHHAAKFEAPPTPLPSNRPLNEARSADAGTRYDADQPPRSHSPQPRIVFNGPVMIGSDKESVALFLETMGKLGKLGKL